MSSTKKEIIAGAVIVGIIALWFMSAANDTITITRGTSSPVVSDATAASIIGWIATLYAIGSVALGVWGITRASGLLENLNRRYTIRVTIPGYFLLAFFPGTLGLGLVAVTGQTVWGMWLALLSLPSVLVLLVFTLKKSD